MQLAPAARLDPQLFCWLKKFSDIAILVIPSGPVPLFETVTFLGELVVPMVCGPKATFSGATVSTPIEVPVPCKVAACGVEVSLAVTLRLPVWAPIAVGVAPS